MADNSSISELQTGVKSAGWLKMMVHLELLLPGNVIVPLVDSAVNEGAVSPRRGILLLRVSCERPVFISRISKADINIIRFILFRFGLNKQIYNKSRESDLWRKFYSGLASLTRD